MFQSRLQTQQVKRNSMFWISRYISPKLVDFHDLSSHFPDLRRHLWSTIWPSKWHWKYTKFGTFNLPYVNYIYTKFHAKTHVGRQLTKSNFMKFPKQICHLTLFFLSKHFAQWNSDAPKNMSMRIRKFFLIYFLYVILFPCL